MTAEHKVVGVFKQIWILLWKNWILFKRNISGTIAEVGVAFLFLLILLVLRFFVDATQSSDQALISTSPLDSINVTTGRYYIYYYPNNAFVQSIVSNAVTFIKASVPLFNVTGKKNLNITYIIEYVK